MNLFRNSKPSFAAVIASCIDSDIRASRYGDEDEADKHAGTDRKG